MRNHVRSRRLLVAGLVGGLVMGAGVAVAGHLVGCAREQVSDWSYLYGTEARNHCSGGDGKDNIYGYGEADELHGGLDQDVLRGATGADQLWDQPGSDAGDDDGVCLGDGADYANVEDLDGKDDIWDIPYPDGATDVYDDRNQYDLVYQENHGCPYAD